MSGQSRAIAPAGTVAEIETQQGSEMSTWNAAQIRSLKSGGIVDANATPDDIRFFAHVCEHVGLDPFAKQIYMIKRNGKMSIQTAIDGYRLIAQRTRDYMPGPVYWMGKDRKWSDVWIPSEETGRYPIAAKVGVRRLNWPDYAYAVATWESYAQYFNGNLGNMWAKMPDVMLAKCAESLALRKAFPAELSGLYTEEEMQQADNQGRMPSVSVNESPASEPPAAIDAPQSRTNIERPTERQIKFIFAIGREIGRDDERIHADAREMFGIDSLNDLDRKSASALIETYMKLREAGAHHEEAEPEPEGVTVDLRPRDEGPVFEPDFGDPIDAEFAEVPEPEPEPDFEPFPRVRYEDGDTITPATRAKLNNLSKQYLAAGGSSRDYIPLVRKLTGKVGFGHLNESQATEVEEFLRNGIAAFQAPITRTR